MNIPLLDLKAQYDTIRDEVREALDGVFESQRFILGPKVKRLEERLASYCGCRHAVGVASGTDALLLALKALGVGQGDAVITSAFTFFATAGAIVNLGALPIFVDIDAAGFGMDPTKLGEFLEDRSPVEAHRSLATKSGAHSGGIKVIIPVHLYGQMAPMAAILDWAHRYGIEVVEDAAQAIGASQSISPTVTTTEGERNSTSYRAGTLGAAGTLSFFPSKNLGAAGDAGMILTNREDLNEELRILRVHGSKPKYVHHKVGWNSRLDEVQAAVLLAKLDHLESWSEARARHAAYYRQCFQRRGLERFCRVPAVLGGNRHIYHQFVIRAQRRDELRAFLKQCGVGTEIYYPVPMHLQECFKVLGYRQGDLPESERASKETLALPIYPELTEDQLDYVVDSIVRFYG